MIPALPASVSVEEPLVGNHFVAAYPPFSAWTREHVPSLKEALQEPAPGKPLGLYIHLPFCVQKCNYCYYLSYIGQSATVVDRYIETLLEEAALYAAQPGVKDRPVSFAYFGGGTPSALSSEQVRRLGKGLRALFPFDSSQEITFECAPRSVRAPFLETLREIGVTRVRMGVQSFDDELLRINGRVHFAEDVFRAFELLRKAGFAWINLDLMCGLLGETDAKWREAIRQMIALNPDSVTIYQTEIPHNTQLYRDLKAGELPAPPTSWEIKRRRLDEGFRELEAAGYSVVSSYNAVKDPRRHRLLYQEYLWRGADMLGLGVASFGYFGGVHAQNATNLEAYESTIKKGELPVRRAFKLFARDQLVREFILQLKFGEVPAALFRKRFDVEISEAFAEPLEAMEDEGWLKRSRNGVHLTRPGLLRIDRLLPRFYDPAFQEIRYT